MGKVIFWQDTFTLTQFIVFTAAFWVFSQHWLSDPKRKTHHYSVMMLSCCERCHSSVSSRLVFVSVRSLRPPDPVDSYTRTVLIKSFCLSLPDCNWWQWLHCLLGWTLWLVDLLYCHAPVLFCSPSARAHEHSTDRKNSKLHTGLGIFLNFFYFFKKPRWSTKGRQRGESQLRISGFPSRGNPPTNTVCFVETLFMGVTHFHK